MKDDLPISIPLAVIDFEASSLSSNGFPIEVGWAIITTKFEIKSGSLLIRPIRTWTDWSVKSEALHGLSRSEIETNGSTPTAVVAALENALGHMAVVSLDPDYDADWADKLYKAASERRKWAIDNIRDAFEACLVHAVPSARSWLRSKLSSLRPHRAEQDARLFANMLLALVNQNDTLPE